MKKCGVRCRVGGGAEKPRVCRKGMAPGKTEAEEHINKGS